MGPVWPIVVGGRLPRGSQAPSLLEAGGTRAAGGRLFLVVTSSLVAMPSGGRWRLGSEWQLSGVCRAACARQARAGPAFCS